jgi:hypothetical protein
MDTPSTPNDESIPSIRVVQLDAANWSRGGELRVGAVPAGATNLNVDGRRLVGPLQGFGRLWQKTYRTALRVEGLTHFEVVRIFKERLPQLQPPQNRFFPSLAGVRPGEVVLINASMTGMPLDTGVLVLYADDEAFTLMTPQGHPESGWITFSAYAEDGVVIAQVQSLARANDPFYEAGFRLFGERAQEQIWTHVLTKLAAHYDQPAAVTIEKTCVDPRCQWKEMRNLRHNAAMLSVLHVVATPLRRARGLARRQGGSGAGRNR